MTPSTRASRASSAQGQDPATDNAAAPHPAASLNQTQRRYLGAMSHQLKPLVMLGNKGATDTVAAELSRTLDHHELVKVKLSGADRDSRQRQLEALLEATGAELVKQIGHTATLFRRNLDQPRLALPHGP